MGMSATCRIAARADFTGKKSRLLNQLFLPPSLLSEKATSYSWEADATDS